MAEGQLADSPPHYNRKCEADCGSIESNTEKKKEMYAQSAKTTDPTKEICCKASKTNESQVVSCIVL